MITCSDCHNVLTILYGKFQDYAYCPSCLNGVYMLATEGCCKQPNIQKVRAIIADGTFQIREQCQHCTFFVSSAISRSKVTNFDDLPIVMHATYAGQTASNRLEFAEMRNLVDSLRHQKLSPSESINPATQNSLEKQTAIKSYRLHQTDIETITYLLNSIYKVFVHDWSFTYSMIAETDGWGYQNSPFTVEEQNWKNMTELTKHVGMVNKLLQEIQKTQ